MTINSFESLQTAIETAYSANEWLANNTNGLFYNMARKSTDLPYAVYFLSAKADHFAVGYTQTFELQFNVFSNVSKKEVSDILLNIKGVFNGVLLTLTGYTNCSAPQIEIEELFKNDTEDWQGTITFTLRIQ